MNSGVVVRPDQVSLGVLVAAVPRDVIDVAVAACGVADKRSGGKLPAHVVAYLTMAMSLFPDDDYEEAAARVTGSLSAWAAGMRPGACRLPAGSPRPVSGWAAT
jgi:Insertion element 4 transposase N-terminal